MCQKHLELGLTAQTCILTYKMQRLTQATRGHVFSSDPCSCFLRTCYVIIPWPCPSSSLRDGPPGPLGLQLILCSWAASPVACWGPGPKEGEEGVGQGQDVLREAPGRGGLGSCGRQGKEEKGFSLFQLVFSSSCSSDHGNR